MSESLLDSNIDQLLANIGMRNVKSGTGVKEEEGSKKAGFWSEEISSVFKKLLQMLCLECN